MAGSLENPIQLAYALASGRVLPGDTFYLRDGTYTGDWVCNLNGTAAQPITFKAYPGERPILNGSLTIGGRYVVWQNVEICYSGWMSRETLIEGSAPADLPLLQYVSVLGVGNKLVNCILHDHIGESSMSNGLGAEWYGCVVYHNGWSGPDRGHGHGLYIQNNAPEKVIKDCVFFDNFGWGIHAYTQGGTINNITLDGCACFENGSLVSEIYTNILVGGYAVANNIAIRNCMTYGGGNVNVGYDAGADNVVLQNNYFPDGITKVNVTNMTETGNYYGPAVGNQVFLRANAYDANRANLVIYNEAAANTIDVDVSAIFGQSGTVKAYNVQDYFTDIQALTITAGVITVNMQAINRTVATPIQWTAPATTFPQFGCFVLVKQ
jgi:hypothetical protein